jgi:hypothetical protein
MAKQVFRIWKSSKCNFIITDYAPEQRKSFSIAGEWQGFVKQFSNNETITEIKEYVKEWLRKQLNQDFDSQFTSKKSFEFLLNELEKENQLTFNL